MVEVVMVLSRYTYIIEHQTDTMIWDIAVKKLKTIVKLSLKAATNAALCTAKSVNRKLKTAKVSG